MIGSLGAFLVLEERKHAEKRGAKPLARLSATFSDRTPRKAGDITKVLGKMWEKMAAHLKAEARAEEDEEKEFGQVPAQRNDHRPSAAAAGAAVPPDRLITGAGCLVIRSSTADSGCAWIWFIPPGGFGTVMLMALDG